MSPLPLPGWHTISAAWGGTSLLEHGACVRWGWLSLNFSVPRLPGMGGTQVNRSRDRTTGNYRLGAFSFLKLFSTPSQQGVCARNTASTCLGLVLVALKVFFPLSGF